MCHHSCWLSLLPRARGGAEMIDPRTPRKGGFPLHPDETTIISLCLPRAIPPRSTLIICEVPVSLGHMEDGCQRFAFVHVPKTGGTTITELWQNSSNAASKLMQHLRHSWHGLTSLSHETAQSMRWHVGGGAQWERTFTFAVVRNP